MRAFAVATAANWAIAAAVTGGCWFAFRPGRAGLAAVLVGGLVLGTALAGYVLRGSRRRATVVCGLVIGMVPALVGSYIATPLLHPAWRAASILQSLVPTWILVVIPLLVCQGFYQGLLGIPPESEKATSQP